MLRTLLRDARAARDLTTTELGAILALPQATVSSWENGSEPKARYIRRLATALGLAVDDILAEIEADAINKGDLPAIEPAGDSRADLAAAVARLQHPPPVAAGSRRRGPRRAGPG